MQIHPGNYPQEYAACLSQQTGHRETSNLRKISLLHDWVFYSVDYPELSFPLCLPRGPSHCVIFHEELSQKEEKFKPTLWSPFQRPRRRCGDFFQGRVCMSQILPSVAGEFGFGFLLNPTLELEALVASTDFPVKCSLWVTAGMLGTRRLGHWPVLASLLQLDSHWHFLPVVGIDWHPAPHTLSVYLGGI